jgi:DNA repair exonuclease SbcCD nuclease subunit
MKILLWSDLHIHEWAQCSSLTEDGLNDRMLDAVKAVEYLNDYCNKNNIQKRIFLGDLHHVRGHVAVSAVSLLRDVLKKAKKSGIKDYFISGNHDEGLNTTFNTMSLYEDIVKVYRKHDLIKLKGSFYASVHPWNDDRVQWREDYLSTLENSVKDSRKVVVSLMHYDFRDIKYRGKNIGEGTSTELLTNWDILSFSGHYHDHHDYGPVIYVGSVMQHNWGDTDTVRGFITCEISESGSVEWAHHKLPGLPEFLKVASLDEAKSKDAVGNFVRYIPPKSSSMAETTDVEDYLKKSGARYVGISLSGFGGAGREVPGSSSEECGGRSEGNRYSDKKNYRSLTSDPEELIESFLQNTETGLNKKKLKKIGLELIDD